MIEIVGAGVGGLSLSLFLSKENKSCVIYEKDTVGGLIAQNAGLRYIHYTPVMVEFLKEIGCNFLVVKRRAKVIWKGEWHDHPYDDMECVISYTEKSTKCKIEELDMSTMSTKKHDRNEVYIVPRDSIVQSLITYHSPHIIFKTYDKLTSNKVVLTSPVFTNLKICQSKMEEHKHELIHRYVYSYEFFATGLSRSCNIVYCPESSVIFHRVSILDNIALEFHSNADKTIMCEVSSIHPLSAREKRDMQLKCALGLMKIGLVEGISDLSFGGVKCIPFGYMISNQNSKTFMENFSKEARAKGVYFLGRFAEWNQDNISQTVEKAKKLAEVL